mmetsp:Transcript_7329/g.19024  ORF Transcript_7329/g.19024 Transcript_7329/m.19024 type:complete len:247 (-) Transcript_7329:448-1188(-)
MERAASSVKGDALALKLQRDKELMVASHIMDRGISHPITIESMGAVPREAFVPGSMKELAYADRPLPIGEDQTISQPYIVALMIDACQPKPTDRALEIGSGSGYATAVLSLCVSRVVAVERIQKLAERSARVLDLLGILRSTSFPFDMQKSKGRVDKYEEDVRGKFEGKLNVDLFVGDGTVGVEEEGPFDIIIVSAAAPAIPQSLVRQLAVSVHLSNILFLVAHDKTLVFDSLRLRFWTMILLFSL